jgi:Glycosyltransferase family 87
MPIWRKGSDPGRGDPPRRTEEVERRDPANQREARGSLPYSSTPTTVLRNAMVLSPLIVLLVLWMWIVAGSQSILAGPNGVVFANSFGTYLGGAEALKEGGNPWDPAQAYRAEKQMLLPQGVEVNEPVWNRHIGNPPLFLWALEPLTDLPFRVAALIWVGAMYALAAASFLVTALSLGWRRPVFACAIFLMMPQVVVGAYYGEAYALLFAALALGLVLAPRHPTVTGALLAVAILKPPIGLPLAMLIWIFHVRDKRRCAAAFVGTNALGVALTFLLVGPASLAQWVVGLAYFSHDMSAQPHVASLIGVYVGWAPTALRSLLEGLTILFACLLTALGWRRRRGDEVTPFRAVAWLWFVWFLASPYSHFYDELMLAIPILVLFGPNGGDASKPIPAAALYAALFSLLVVSWMPLNVSLLPVPLVLVGYFLFRAARQSDGAAVHLDGEPRAVGVRQR